jgi:hypothetical protein
MANPNPDALKARRAARARRRPKPGTVKQLTSVLWRAITHLETHLDTTVSAGEVDTAELCKLTHALSQSAATYLKAVEVGELEARLRGPRESSGSHTGAQVGSVRLRTRLDRLATSRTGHGSIEVWITEDGETFTCGNEVLSARELERRQSAPGVLVVDRLVKPPTP